MSTPWSQCAAWACATGTKFFAVSGSVLRPGVYEVMGTQRQAEILHRIAAGRARPSDAADLLELAAVLSDTSICGLGQAAPWVIVNAHQHWPALFEAA